MSDHSTFVDWAAERIRDDAKRTSNTPQLLRILKEETEERWWQRAGRAEIDQLALNFVMTTGNGVMCNSYRDESIAIFRKLKELFASELAPRPTAK